MLEISFRRTMSVVVQRFLVATKQITKHFVRLSCSVRFLDITSTASIVYCVEW